MSETTITETSALEVVRTFADAYAHGDAAPAAHLLHPDVQEKAVVAGGYEVDARGRDAILAELDEFLAPYGRPEIVHQSIEPIGPYFRWSLRWRLQKGDETSLLDKLTFVTAEDGLITRFDVACTGRMPEV